ncbi:MAG: hypothetical protein AB7P12_09735 [Alphaproteobacteria bacterium]
MLTAISTAGAVLGALILAALGTFCFLVRDKGKLDIDGEGPAPQVSRVPALIALGVVTGIYAFLVSWDWPPFSALVAGFGIAGGFSMGHWGAYGLWYSLPAERNRWLYGKLVLEKGRTSRQWLTAPMLALNGGMVTLGPAVGLYLAGGDILTCIAVYVAGWLKLPAYVIGWEVKPPPTMPGHFWHGNTIASAIHGGTAMAGIVLGWTLA